MHFVYITQSFYTNQIYTVMKRLLIILPLILCFITSCQDKKAKEDLEAMKAKEELEEQNKALYQRILAEGDKKNLAILDEVCAPDYKYYFPSNGKPINLEENKNHWQALIVAFPDLNHTIEEIYAVGDIVVTREIIRGTHKGEFAGMPPTGKKVEFGAIKISRCVDGKLAEIWAESDAITMYQQLGMELQMKEVKE